MKDMIIIGAGPAGLTASIYGVRSGMDLVLIEKLSPGGQVMNTYEVENYPGFAEPIAGWDLMSRMEQQARRLGVEIISGDIHSVSRGADGRLITGIAGGKTLEAKTVIAASGSSYRKLNIPGEKEFIGKGVSFCATCDGAFFKNRTVAVIGGGNTALEEAIFLTRFAAKVYLVHRRESFRGVKLLQDRVLACEKIEPVYDSIPMAIHGSGRVEALSIKNIKFGNESSLKVDGVFIFIGFDPNTGYLPENLLNDKKEAMVDSRFMTGMKGLFAAGDLREASLRQIVMAASDGASAAMHAYEYINGIV